MWMDIARAGVRMNKAFTCSVQSETKDRVFIYRGKDNSCCIYLVRYSVTFQKSSLASQRNWGLAPASIVALLVGSSFVKPTRGFYFVFCCVPDASFLGITSEVRGSVFSVCSWRSPFTGLCFSPSSCSQEWEPGDSAYSVATALMLGQFSSQTLQKLLSRTGMLLYFLSHR